MNNNTVTKETVIQFGEGGFLRGFVDWMLKKMKDKGLFFGSVVVVQPIEDGMCDTLTSQGCRYTHLIRGKEGVEILPIDVISRCVKPYDSFDEYLSLADNPDFRFVVSNTTESGIIFNPEDKISDAPSVSFPAKVALLLKRRMELGLPGFIFLPCELIDRNGDNLRACIKKYGSLWGFGEKFEKFVDCENVFANTLVDRINTGYPKDENIELGYEDKLLNTSEYFHLWVIETDFDIEAELPFSKAGLNVVITKDKLHSYRERKVRILNGAHTSLVAYALLSDLATVRECTENNLMSEHLRGCIFDEIIPTLDLPRDELVRYADEVLVRFANPYVNHMLSAISLNSVSKFKVRVLPSILEYKRRFGRYPERLTLSLAKLIEFYKTCDPKDSPDVIEYIRSHTLLEILKNTAFWGEDISDIYAAVKEVYNAD